MSTDATTETPLHQGVGWIAKHWPRLRLGHEAFMLVEHDPELAQRTYALLRQLFSDSQKGLGEFADVA